MKVRVSNESLPYILELVFLFTFPGGRLVAS